MTRTVGGFLLGVAVTALAWALWPTEPAPVPEEAEPRAALESASPSIPLPAVQPAPEPVSRGMVLVLPENEPVEADRQAEREPLSIAAKLVPARMSEVPHQLIGAWDEAADSERPGQHRTFVAVVEPNLSSSELESLAFDIAARHREAEVLDVRVYDAEDAEGNAPDASGTTQHGPLVARIVRNDRLGFEQLTVRGEQRQVRRRDGAFPPPP